MSAVADHKGIKLRNADIHISHEVFEGKPWSTAFNVQIDLGGGFTQREKKILFNSARLCDIHKILTGECTFEFQLVTPPVKEETKTEHRTPNGKR